MTERGEYLRRLVAVARYEAWVRDEDLHTPLAVYLETGPGVDDTTEVDDADDDE